MFLKKLNPTIIIMAESKSSISKSHLKSKLQEMRLRGENTDVKIICNDGTTFPVHKLVIICSSSYFEKMFSGSFEEAKTGVARVDFDPKTIAKVLDFAYLENDSKVELEDMDQADALLRAADMFNMAALFKACCDAVKKVMNDQKSACFYTASWNQTIVDHFLRLAYWNHLFRNDQTQKLLNMYVNRYWDLFLDNEELFLQCDNKLFMQLVEKWSSKFSPLLNTIVSFADTRPWPSMPDPMFGCETYSEYYDASASIPSVCQPDYKVDVNNAFQVMIQRIIKWVEHNRQERESQTALLFSKLQIPLMPSSFVKTLLEEELVKNNCDVLVQLFKPFLQ